MDMLTPSRAVDRAFEEFKEALRTIGVDTGDLILKEQAAGTSWSCKSAGTARLARQWGTMHTLRSRWFFSSTSPRP
jgi:hypothetical protein